MVKNAVLSAVYSENSSANRTAHGVRPESRHEFYEVIGRPKGQICPEERGQAPPRGKPDKCRATTPQLYSGAEYYHFFWNEENRRKVSYVCSQRYVVAVTSR